MLSLCVGIFGDIHTNKSAPIVSVCVSMYLKTPRQLHPGLLMKTAKSFKLPAGGK